MHTEIAYNGNKEKALQDAKDWLSKKQYNALAEYAKGADRNIETFRFMCAFTGISGFPVDALWEHLTSFPSTE